jgi:hypothetical protein
MRPVRRLFNVRSQRAATPVGPLELQFPIDVREGYGKLGGPKEGR